MWSVSSGFGKHFFAAGFMPALAFLAAIDLVVAPYFLDQGHLVDTELLGISGVVLIVGGVFVAFFLLSLNVPIIRLYQNGLVISSWLEKRNRARQKTRYEALEKARKEYDAAKAQARETASASGAAESGAGGLEYAVTWIEKAHQTIERENGVIQDLPYDPKRVKATDLGNVMAVTADYAYERYGMDNAIFWPRLLEFISGDYQAQLADLKTTMDFYVNLSFLSGAFGLIAVVVGLWYQSPLEVVLGLLAAVIAYGLYRGAVESAANMGTVVKGSYDLFRGELAAKLGLPKPDRLADERREWKEYASFIRRGEEFYYPDAPQTPKTDDA
jgi:hypothetical protein